jgi:2-oxoglutarate ferredoxin oxidoreductase subunit beta
VARGYSADIPFLIDLIVEGIKHSGFSLIDILQPCPTFNKDMPYEWYQKRVYKLQDHQGLKLAEAFAKLDEADKLVTGVLYRSNRNAYHVHLPQLSETSLLGQSIANINIESLVKEFK